MGQDSQLQNRVKANTLVLFDGPSVRGFVTAAPSTKASVFLSLASLGPGRVRSKGPGGNEVCVSGWMVLPWLSLGYLWGGLPPWQLVAAYCRPGAACFGGLLWALERLCSFSLPSKVA